MIGVTKKLGWLWGPTASGEYHFFVGKESHWSPKIWSEPWWKKPVDRMGRVPQCCFRHSESMKIPIYDDFFCLGGWGWTSVFTQEIRVILLKKSAFSRSTLVWKIHQLFWSFPMGKSTRISTSLKSWLVVSSSFQRVIQVINHRTGWLAEGWCI